MPTAPKKPCAMAHCTKLTHDRWCEKHRKEAQWKKTPDGIKRHRLYQTPFWRINRQQFLANHPLCRECEKEGRTKLATDVDHIVPHRGDRELFEDENNWQPLCRECHNKKTRRGE